MRLSHSSSEKYGTCPKMWYLHYRERLRSTTIGSALLIGSAMDDAFGRLLLDKKKSLTDSDKLLMNATPEETFISSMSKVFLNGEYIDVAESSQLRYYKSDCDTSLLNEQDKDAIVDFGNELGFDFNLDGIDEFVKEFQAIKSPENIDEIRLYNNICYKSWIRKGLILIDAYRRDVLPQIHEVFEIQKEISLPDGEGNEVVGYIDIIASFVDEPDKKYIIDNKTSSRKYPEDAVLTSNQLATYCEHEQIYDAAFIVVEKKLRKRSPITRIQILRDKMPQEHVEETFDNLQEVFYNIKERKFEENWDSCFQYGQPCPYYYYCRGGSLKNLVKLEER